MTWTIRVNGFQTFLFIALFAAFEISNSTILGIAIAAFLIGGSLVFPRYHILPAGLAVFLIGDAYPAMSPEYIGSVGLFAYTLLVGLWNPLMVSGVVAVAVFFFIYKHTYMALYLVKMRFKRIGDKWKRYKRSYNQNRY